jgi:hypothetical protein
VLAARFLPPRLGALSPAAGLAAGATAAFAGIAGWPAWPPVDTLGWLVFATPAAALLGLAAELRHRPVPPWLAAAVLLPWLAGVSWLLLRPLAARWGDAGVMLVAAVPAAGGAAVWLGLDLLARRLRAAAPLAALAASSAGAALVLVAARSALLGQLFGGLAAAFGAAAVAALFVPSLRLGRAALAASLTAYLGLLVYAAFYARVAPLPALLLLAAPLAPLAAWRVRRTWLAVAVSVLVALLPAATSWWLVRAERAAQDAANPYAAMYE